ncbi:PucR family transcriptional regulator [Cytobacillus dafuensis]|nr:helix-turn-helix domain-containing protein [Cytobacillus dafuensis]
MKNSLQDLLIYIPLSQLTYITSLPKELVHYETILDNIPGQLLERPTLIILKNYDEWKKLNETEITIRLIQDPNLIGMVLCHPDPIIIQEEVFTHFLECQLPIIQVPDHSLIHVFQQTNEFLYPYSQLSIELQGFMEKGFISLASELSKGLNTPLLYFDQNEQILWQTGEKEELQEANRWFNIHRRKLKNGEYSNLNTDVEGSFQVYTIQISEFMNHSLLASAQLLSWQKRMVDKLVGLTALSLQTQGIFEEQQEIFKEHFIYDLLFHKFESKKVMIKQGKTWGWNLEKPHHLLILNIELSDEFMTNMNWLEEIILFLEAEAATMKETIIVFPFQDQIILLLEDAEERINSERKNYVVETISHIEKSLSSKWSNIRFKIGIGKWYQDTINLNKSYQEAKLALQFGQSWFENNKNIFHINNLGIFRLLIHIQHELLYDFSLEYLSTLIEGDRENGTEYIKTLQAYIQHQGKISEVSETLYVHPNTLRNRLKKIEDITGLQLQDINDLLILTIAVGIYSFVHT